MLGPIVTGKDNHRILFQALGIQRIQQSSDVIIHHTHAPIIGCPFFFIGPADYLRATILNRRSLFPHRLSTVWSNKLFGSYYRGVRLTEPKHRQKRLTWVTFLKKHQSLINNYFRHPALQLRQLLTVAIKTFRIFAKILRVGQPVFKPMISRVWLF